MLSETLLSDTLLSDTLISENLISEALINARVEQLIELTARSIPDCPVDCFGSVVLMPPARSSLLQRSIDSLLFQGGDLRELFATAAEAFGRLLAAQRVVILEVNDAAAGATSAQRSGGQYPAVQYSTGQSEKPPIEWVSIAVNPELDGMMVDVTRYLQDLSIEDGAVLTFSEPYESKLIRPVADELNILQTGSVTICPVFYKSRMVASVVAFFTAAAEPASDAISACETLSHYFGVAISHAHQRSAVIPGRDRSDVVVPINRGNRSDVRYRRLLEHSEALIFHIDQHDRLDFVSRRSIDFFGLSPEEVLSGEPVRWTDFIHPDDSSRVSTVLAKARETKSVVDEECRVINRVTSKTRWILVRLVPVTSGEQEQNGWDGFAIDITERRDVQDALDAQSKKVRALYAVSHAIRGFLEPRSIASRGLAALCDATSAQVGAALLTSNAPGKQLELVAEIGFSKPLETNDSVRQVVMAYSGEVASRGQSTVIGDFRSDPQLGRILVDEEKIKSGLFVPICADEETLGTLVLFSRDSGHFDGGDILLASAAGNQIGLAARQANLFAAFRKSTKNLSALYRISHELSTNISLEDLFQNAFSIIRDELGLKRLWLGLLDDTGSRLVGQAAYGPGFRRRLVEINVEVKGREHPLAKVVETRTPLVIANSEDVLRELGVRRIFSQLAIHSMALVPLVTGGQVLGVIAVQPSSDEPALDDDEMNLLVSLSNEIATILLARRLEDQIREGEKMRTAGLLAAGIAHNFNNLLQAILGQASLLEMQNKNESRVNRAVRIINDAANRGASLVRQLVSFAHLDDPVRESVDVNTLIQRSEESFERMLLSDHELVLELSPELPRANVDPRQFLRVLNALLSNAVESMTEGGVVTISTDLLEVDRENVAAEVTAGRYIRVAVRDTGVGMDDQTKRRCFEPFFTTKNVDPASGLGLSGAGLGLAAAYAIARRNGGRLTVESRPGQGSMFTFFVPLLESKNAELGIPARTIEHSGEAHSLRLVDKAPLQVERVSFGSRGTEAGFGKKQSERRSGKSRAKRENRSRDASRGTSEVRGSRIDNEE